MKRTFFVAAAALIAIDLVFTQRWERIIHEQSAHAELLRVELEGWRSSLGDFESRLEEREEIAAAMFSALADARSALLGTIEQMSDDDCGQEIDE